MDRAAIFRTEGLAIYFRFGILPSVYIIFSKIRDWSGGVNILTKFPPVCTHA
jgi:hypothetical protein